MNKLTTADLMDAIRSGVRFSRRDFTIVNYGPNAFGVELVGGASANANFPFRAIKGVKGTMGHDNSIQVVDGTIGGMTPVIGTTPINTIPPPELAINVTDDLFFKISVTVTSMNIGDADTPFYIVGGGIITAIVIEVFTATSPPSDGVDASVDPDTGGVTGGTYYRRITTWTGDALTSQPIETSLEYSICSNGTNDSGQSDAKLTLFRA